MKDDEIELTTMSSCPPRPGEAYRLSDRSGEWVVSRISSDGESLVFQKLTLVRVTFWRRTWRKIRRLVWRLWRGWR